MVDQKHRTYTITTPKGHEVPVRRLSKKDVENKIAEFEAKYGMSSREFAAKWNAGELDCAVRDYFKWVGYCHIMHKRGCAELRIAD
ncbi:MAG: cell division protein ZapA [Chloroflexi bacterium]|nr:cell division protein ZapA [Chloroflexota bacterium]